MLEGSSDLRTCKVLQLAVGLLQFLSGSERDSVDSLSPRVPGLHCLSYGANRASQSVLPLTAQQIFPLFKHSGEEQGGNGRQLARVHLYSTGFI